VGTELASKRIALITAELVEEHGFIYPLYRLREAGAEVTVVGLEPGEIRGYNGLPIMVDTVISDITPESFDAVVFPGGYGPDLLRQSPEVLAFVRNMNASNKLIAYLCHAAWIPASAEIIQGRRTTGAAAIRRDLENAGAVFEDAPVVVDGNFVSSRNYKDSPAWVVAIIAALSTNDIEGREGPQGRAPDASK
jgi:protease I